MSAQPPVAPSRGSTTDVDTSGSLTPDLGDAGPVTIAMDTYNWGVDFRVARHALEFHGLNPGAYCREVYGRA